MPTLDEIRQKYPQYKDMPDQALADGLYKKFYSDMPRDQFNSKLGFNPQPEQEKPEEAPAMEVGPKAFEFAASAARPALDLLGGTIQHGASLLAKLGFNVDPQAAADVRKKMTDNYNDFVKRSMKHYGGKEEDYPVAKGVGDAAGELLLYAATGPAFTAGAIGKGLAGLGPILGSVIQGAAQGGVIEGLRSQRKGSEAFYDALGGAFGGGIGGGIGATIGALGTKLANAKKIGSIVKDLKIASQGWEEDNGMLAKAFTDKLSHINAKQTQLQTLAEQQLIKAGLKPDINAEIPASAPAVVKDSVELVKKYMKDTEFLRSNVFSKLTTTGGSDASFFQANEQVLRAITGKDKEISQRVWNAFSDKERALLQKGIMYQALQKGAKHGGKIDPEKVKEFLDSPGVKVFFPGKGGELLKGFQNIVGESESHNWAAHPFATSHLAWALTGGALGYERGEGDFESVAFGALAGYASYIATVSMIKGLLGSQMGRNLLAAAAHAEPGTPQIARIFSKAANLSMTTLGARYERTEMAPHRGPSVFSPPSSEGEGSSR